jgi:hypothetical protein
MASKFYFSCRFYLKLPLIKYKRCINDYIQVIDNTGVYKVCGVRKYTFENKLCSSVIYIRYKAETLLNNLYRGFRVYYECELIFIL